MLTLVAKLLNGQSNIDSVSVFLCPWRKLVSLVIANVVCLLFLCSEPGAPPDNVSGKKISSTSVLVQWDIVPIDKQHGEIVSYTVFYWETEKGQQETNETRVPSSRREETLSGLVEYTYYSIQVLASTIKGGGPRSPVRVVQTDEDSK